MGSQHIKASERLLKSVQQYFFQIFLALCKEISSKISVLVVSVILRLFVNILKPNEKHSLTKSKCLTQPIQMQLSRNEQIFSIFLCISGMYIKFEKLWKRIWASEVISFWTYRLQKGRLLKCLKNRVSEHSWTVSILTGPKHFTNLHAHIFVIFFDHSDRKSTRKTLV